MKRQHQYFFEKLTDKQKVVLWLYYLGKPYSLRIVEQEIRAKTKLGERFIEMLFEFEM